MTQPVDHPSGESDVGLNHRVLAMLGAVTICAYGSWYYSFGVLLDPIKEDTGWSESTLAASYSIGLATIGIASMGGGWLLDRIGHRRVFAIAGVGGSSGLIVASAATNPSVFVAAAIVGMGFTGALGFYHITMPTAVRLHPTKPKQAIAVLTVWGAFASALFLPLAGWFVDAVGWRDTIRAAGAVQAASFAVAAWCLPTTAPTDATRNDAAEKTPPPSSILTVARRSVDGTARRHFTACVALTGIAMSTLLVYQVPAMTAAGLSAPVAATVAGARGLAQLGGRLPLTRIIAALGLDRSFTTALAAIAVSGLVLLQSGALVPALAFAVIAGFGVGAFSPLQGMKAEQLFDRPDLGATMGLYNAALLLCGSAGPTITAALIATTADRRWIGVVITTAGGTAALLASRSHLGRHVGDASHRTRPL